ncbi:hypothetical protein SAMN05216511_6500 [Streptomyces sp. KS_16]|nr:hypothetical protein BX261_0720 [Streptomyces sp. 2321.6]SDR57017.1 hypothetical protein SAMN05216511_6500 [Streptomyces sp. KS_16]SEB92048.1 hypothetical protein SAMN05428940_0719 [Streptomyces sp. 2133.1]SNC62580.1 hypothetical protein SAMN06272741_0718 [Streptomyces sp. 2114.4]
MVLGKPCAMLRKKAVPGMWAVRATIPWFLSWSTRSTPRYPGHVRAQGVDVVGADGKVLTDFDIVTQNVVVQVKSGSGKGALKQALRTQELTDYPVIAYLPQGRGSVIKSLEQAGVIVTRDKKVLLDILAPWLRPRTRRPSR